MKRNKREHGRILSVETLARGDALAVDVAAGATSLTVNDAGDFDEDGGWLHIGAQTVAYTACDDDTGAIALADPLTAAGEEGDPVHVWSDLYDETVEYQQALVELDGEYDNPDPVVAEVAEGVGDLPEGDRGKAGESCTLLRVADDEWEVVGVGGRSRKSRGLRAEADDGYTLTADDVAAGVATIPLTHRPEDEWMVAFWRTTPQRPTNYTVNYEDRTVTWPLAGFEKAGDVLWVHYAYRKGLASDDLPIPLSTGGWRYLEVAIADATNRAAVGFDHSSWAEGSTPFGLSEATGLDPNWTLWNTQSALWVRRAIRTKPDEAVVIAGSIDNIIDIYWNGTLVLHADHSGTTMQPFTVTVPVGEVKRRNVLAIRAQDDIATYGGNDGCYLNVSVVKA